MYISDKTAKRFLRESFELDAMFAFSLQLFWQKSLFSNTPNVKAQVFFLFLGTTKKKSITKPRQLKKQEKCKRIGITISECM